MSGTDYNQTPNHGLYLPIYDMDEGQWGSHLNSNTTALDTLLATTGTTTFLPINGGTMNGKLTLFSAPSAAMDAATKGYVDGLLTGAPFMPMSGGTMTGMLTLFSDPAGAMDAVTKQYADKMLPLAGGTMTGPVVLADVSTVSTAAPGTNTTQIASTAFVTAAVSTGVGAYLPLAGGTVTGPTTFNAAGTALTVTNNASIGGTLSAGATTVNGTLTTTGTSQIQLGNATSINNIIRINPTAAGTTPNIVMVGKDTDVGLTFNPQGAGVFTAPRIAAGANITMSGTFANAQSPLSLASNISGTSTDPYRNVVQHNITSDNVNSSVLQAMGINHNYGGAAMTGARIGFATTLTQTAATQNSTNTFYQGGQFTARAYYQEPGSTAPDATNARGILFALSTTTTLGPNAINYSGLAGCEFDIAAGASPYGILGVSVIRLTGGFGTNYQAAVPQLDCGFRVGGGVAPNASWINGYTITSPTGNFGLDPAQGIGFIIFPGHDYVTNPPKALRGIDLSYVQFSNSAWHSQGAIIDPVGAATFSKLTTGNWSRTISSSGMSIDTGGNQIALSAAVAAGGAGYNINEQFSFAGNGRGMVTAQTGGVVSAIQILEYPTSTSPPANPVTTTSLMIAAAAQATGSGLTLTLTWSVANALSLNPSAGATTIGGTLGVAGTTSHSAGINLGSALAPGGANDLTRHISLYGTAIGFSVTSGRLNYRSDTTGTAHVFMQGAVDKCTIGSTGINLPAGEGYSVNALQVVGSRITGWGTSTGGARAAIAAGTATLPQVAAGLAQLLVDLQAHGLLGT
jgi:hypothetical protein